MSDVQEILIAIQFGVFVIQVPEEGFDIEVFPCDESDEVGGIVERAVLVDVLHQPSHDISEAYDLDQVLPARDVVLQFLKHHAARTQMRKNYQKTRANCQ